MAGGLAVSRTAFNAVLCLGRKDCTS